MTKRVEPILRRKLIEALEDAEDARTQKERANKMGMAYGYADSLDQLAKVERYKPVGGIAPSIHNYDPMENHIARVRKYMSGDEAKTRKMLGLDVEP